MTAYSPGLIRRTPDHNRSGTLMRAALQGCARECGRSFRGISCVFALLRLQGGRPPPAVRSGEARERPQSSECLTVLFQSRCCPRKAAFRPACTPAVPFEGAAAMLPRHLLRNVSATLTCLFSSKGAWRENGPLPCGEGHGS
ncbi:hypothetical protein Sfum_1029 [Syntrophobacter fumaroxidans MPOB]|uniref:Uncharacterized protein n=1 Tax=Syntrophobacter fumaroxidans (strain DSM 10017 / MPOB) TaxID=335543 RepID=A0LH21_SYNFM|nr:hypothetical protein Sfum_1029 [Syntrophobacter fumaroxidans MPOB]